MPRLMDKKDWIQTVANVGVAERVWSESLRSRAGTVSLSVPEDGMYIKIDPSPEIVMSESKSVHGFIGNGRTGQMRIGSMKEEIGLPDDFDREFGELPPYGDFVVHV